MTMRHIFKVNRIYREGIVLDFLRRFAPTRNVCYVVLFGCLGFWKLEMSASVMRNHFQPSGENEFLAPSAIVTSSDGLVSYVACEWSQEILVLRESCVVNRLTVAGPPSGLALSEKQRRLYVTCGGANGSVQVVDTVALEVLATIPTGYQTQSPVLNPGGGFLYVCNRFDNLIHTIDLQTLKTSKRIAVSREPFSMAITPDGQHLLVAHHLHSGPSNTDVVTTFLSVINVNTGKCVKEIRLPNGSTMLRDIRISPDGLYAVVAHIVARFHLPTTQIERGWINSNAISLIDLSDMSRLNTVLVDNINAGAATPWAIQWSGDGAKLCITHAGTHELSVIDFSAMIEKLRAVRLPSEVSNDLTFLVGIRHRIPLVGRGPRSLSVVGQTAQVAHYFSDTIEYVDLIQKQAPTRSIFLGSEPKMTQARIGEYYFNDATLSFQGWQACSSCHSHDARVDGMNWDNLNDGLGNPKNVKSLLQANQTPPMMWLGVRADSKVAVRAGLRHGLFSVQPVEVAEALDAYIASLKPMPSPHLQDGKLSPAAKRGRRLFFDQRIGCARCHTGVLYTDQQLHHVGTAGRYDQPDERFDTPSLVEIWRTAPYLHDGSAASLKELFPLGDAPGRHGATGSLNEDELDDLVAFLLSL